MNYLPTYLLTAEETLTTSTRLKEIILESIDDDPFVNMVTPKIVAANNKLSKAIGRTTSQSYTKQLNADDDLRDTAFIGFRDYVKAFTNSSNQEKQKAAHKLFEVINTIGWTLWSEGYVTESALLKTLIIELEKQENLTAIKTIEAEEWFENLIQAHTNFEATYMLKVETEAEKNTPLTKESKKEIAKYLLPLLDYINLNAELKNGNFSEVSKKIDEVISKIMSIVRSRKTRKVNASSND